MGSRTIAVSMSLCAMLAFPTGAQAQVLFDQTNLPVQNSPISLNFTTGSTSTSLQFGGYDVPSFVNLSDISLVAVGSSTNLLGSTFTFTPAPSGSLASQGGPGAFGTNNLSFGGVSEGSYDLFSQNFASIVGNSYNLSFTLSNSTLGRDGLRITASNSTLQSAVPEPATWAMMLMGFGAMGFALRRRKRVATLTQMA